MSKGGGVDIPDHYDIKVGGTGTPLTVDADLDNIHIREIAPVTVNSNVAVTQPIVTDSKLAITQPIVTDSHVKVDPLELKVDPLDITTHSDSSSTIDVKPLAVDSCQTLKLAPLPNIKLEQPFSQHVGITFMGVELWGVNISGNSEMCLHSPPRSRHVSSHFSGRSECCDEEPRDQSDPPSPAPQPRSGLRVRVK